MTQPNDQGQMPVLIVRTSQRDGLDQQAVNALRDWTFKPGTREGKPVAVSVEMSFTLK